MPSAAFPTINGRYTPLRVLGRGSMGVVYQAADKLNKNEVALKRVPLKLGDDDPVPARRSGSATLTDQALALAREFRLLATLRHPNIISVLDYGFDSNRQPYLVMDLLENSRTITHQSTSLSIRQIADRLLQLLSALDYLHWRGVVHHDLKPNNVLVLADGRVKVLDFGLAMLVDRPEEVSGTPAYLPPEVILADDPSELEHRKIDLYETGVLAYEMLTGWLPFWADDLGLLADKIINEEPDLSRVGIFGPIIERLLVKDPAQRYDSARAVIDDLNHLLGEAPLPETEMVRESFLQSAQFIGREAELTRLSDEMDTAFGGQGTSWLIGGESGVGKSRLMDELAIRALGTGALVLRGQAHRYGRTGYHLWRPLLRHLCLAVDVDDFESQVIKVLVPDVAELLERPVLEPEVVDPKSAQERLLFVLESLFCRCAKPLFIILEDLQWADGESLALLSRLTHTAKDRALFIVGTYRNDEAPDLAAVLADMKYLPIDRLTEESITRLSEAILGLAGKQPAVVRWLQQETEGNVFFLVEILRVLAASAGRLDAIGSIHLPEHVSTPNIAQVIRSRLKKVRTQFRFLLEIAAIIGRQIDLQVMHQLAQDVDLDVWLFECAEAAVLEVHDGIWRFSHDKVREELLGTLSRQQQIKLHRQAALGIERAYSQAHAALAGLLAYHWGEAGDLERELHYTVLAGEHALQNGINQEAQRLLERALNVDVALSGSQVSAAHRLRRAHWHREAGDSCLWVGDLDRSYQHMHKALALLGFAEPEGRAGLVLRLVQAISTQTLHRALPSRQQGRKNADSGPLLEAGLALSRTAEAHWYAGRKMKMMAAAFSALNYSEKAGSSSIPLVIAYGNASVITAYLGLRSLTHVYLRRGLEVARSLGDPFALSFALTRSALYAIGRGDWTRLETACIQANELERQIGAERYWRETTSLLSISSFWRGHFDYCLGSVIQLQESAKGGGDLHYQAVSWFLQAHIYLTQARMDQALQALSEAVAIVQQMGAAASLMMILWRDGLRARVNARLGNLDQALQDAEATLKRLGTNVGANYSVLIGLLGCVDALITVIDHSPTEGFQLRARQALHRCERLLRTYARRWPVGLPTYARVAGFLEYLAGHEARAKKIWCEGLLAAQRFSLLPEQGLLEFEIGRHLQETDAYRVQHLDNAQAILASSGAVYYTECVQARRWLTAEPQPRKG